MSATQNGRRPRHAESIGLAKEAFGQATALDPAYAEAHAELATWHFVQGAAGLRRPVETMPMARRYAQQALELTPAKPRAHAVMGVVAALYEGSIGPH